MKIKPKLTADEAKPKSNKGKAKGLRSSIRKAYYSSRPAFTLANKKRTFARHLRHFPEDKQAITLFQERYRVTATTLQLQKPCGKARKRMARA